ncbi:MAG: hypothetical protein ACREDA_01330 [Methylocella sp.]
MAGDAAGLVTGPWRTAPEIETRVAGGGGAIDGLAALSGLPKPIHSVDAECGQK